MLEYYSTGKSKNPEEIVREDRIALPHLLFHFKFRNITGIHFQPCIIQFRIFFIR